MKGLFKRGNVWWYRFTPVKNAAQVQMSLGTSDEREAITRALEHRETAAVEMGAVMAACETEVDLYLASLKRDHLSKETISSRGYILKAFVKTLDVATPHGITLERLQTWFDGRWKDYPHTAVAYLNVVRWWLDWLVGRGKLKTNPAKEVQVPQNLPMQRRRRFLKPKEARKTIDECTDDDDLKFALYCALQHGMRKLEIIEAPPSFFDIEAGLIHITETATFTPKDREKRTIPMTNEFKEWLQNTFGVRGPFMLHSKETHGKYRYRYDFRKTFIAHMKKCGFPDVTFHDLRRTFASLLASEGVSIYKIAKWLGDTVEQTENTYGHLIPEDDDINPSWAKKSTKKKDQPDREQRSRRVAQRPRREPLRRISQRTRSHS